MRARLPSMEDQADMVLNDKGRTLISELRNTFSEFNATEESLLVERENRTAAAAARSIWIVILGTLMAIALGVVAMLFTVRSILRQVGGEPAIISGMAEQIVQGNLDVQLEDDPKTSTGIRTSVITMTEALRENRDRNQRQDWLKTGIARLNDVMSGEPDIETLASKVISELATYLDAQVGALYLAQNGGKPSLSLIGSYAYSKRKNLSSVFTPGEGLAGQATLEKQQILVKNVPEDYIKVTSGLGERVPRFICVTPFLYEGR